VARAQLDHAGLSGPFELVLSADAVRRLKPAPEPYRMAAERLGVAVGEVRLVAAHAWDVAGAARAGCATDFVARPGKVPTRWSSRPRSSARIWPRSPTASSPPTAEIPSRYRLASLLGT
jgi:FMN phosphatase YigB (HAD superfamily)